MRLAAAVWCLTSCGGGGAGGAGGETPPAPIHEAATSAPAVVDEVVPAGFELAGVTLTMPDGGEQALDVWVADTVGERGRGLMDVSDLGEADGMLFQFESEGVYRFYMWQTRLPLDIAFFAADGSFVGSSSMEPCLEPSSSSCERYDPGTPFVLALELPAGELEALDIGPGTRLTRD